MRGCGAFRARVFHIFQNADCKRRALGGVCAGAEFVEKAKTFFADFRQNIHDVNHMRGKCAQTLLNALFVADVGKNVLKHRDFRALLRGDMQARKRHNRQKSDCFKRYRFTARVRTRDNQRVEIFSKINIGCNHLFGVD